MILRGLWVGWTIDERTSANSNGESTRVFDITENKIHLDKFTVKVIKLFNDDRSTDKNRQCSHCSSSWTWRIILLVASSIKYLIQGLWFAFENFIINFIVYKLIPINKISLKRSIEKCKCVDNELRFRGLIFNLSLSVVPFDKRDVWISKFLFNIFPRDVDRLIVYSFRINR